MNKKISVFFEENGWQVINNLARKNVNGYIVELHYGINTMYPFVFLISCHVEEADRTILNYEFKNLKYKYFVVNYCPFGVIVGLNDLTYGAFVKNFNEKFNNIINVLIKNNIKNSLYCPICGELLKDESKEENKEVITITHEGYYVTLHKDCLDQVNSKIEELNEEFDKAPNNYGKGIIGSLIGAFVGALLYIIIYLIGFISSWSAILGMGISTKLYEKFKAKKNKMMILIVVLPNFIFQLLAVVGIYMLVAKAAYIENGNTDLSTLSCFTYFLQNDAEFVSSFVKELLLSLVFSAIGIIPVIRSLKIKTERKSKI